jgi:tetratricopeptide (TPR) repeat protein
VAHWKGGHKQVCVALETRAPAAQAAVEPIPDGAPTCCICKEFKNEQNELFLCRKKGGHYYCTTCLFSAKSSRCALCKSSLVAAFGASFLSLSELDPSKPMFELYEKRARELPFPLGLSVNETRNWNSMKVSTMCVLANLLWTRGDGDKDRSRAIDWFERASILDLEDYRTSFWTASCYDIMGRSCEPGALVAARRAWSLNKFARSTSNILVETLRAHACGVASESNYLYLKEAEKCMFEVRDRFPKHAWVHFYLSLIYDTYKNYKAACDCMIKALTIAPSDYSFFNHTLVMFQMLWADLEGTHKLAEFDVYRPFIAEMIPKAHKMDPVNFVKSATFEQLMDKEFKWRPTALPVPRAKVLVDPSKSD